MLFSGIWLWLVVGSIPVNSPTFIHLLETPIRLSRLETRHEIKRKEWWGGSGKTIGSESETTNLYIKFTNNKTQGKELYKFIINI